MKKQPIVKFKNIDEANTCLKEWQDRLFLNDWIIHLELTTEVINGNNAICGINEYCFESKESSITIRNNRKTFISKICAEKTLIHELLHCKYNWLVKDKLDFQEAYFDTLEHQLLEEMAKSLLMAKYDLTFDWFKSEVRKC